MFTISLKIVAQLRKKFAWTKPHSLKHKIGLESFFECKPTWK